MHQPFNSIDYPYCIPRSRVPMLAEIFDVVVTTSTVYFIAAGFSPLPSGSVCRFQKNQYEDGGASQAVITTPYNSRNNDTAFFGDWNACAVGWDEPIVPWSWRPGWCRSGSLEHWHRWTESSFYACPIPEGLQGQNRGGATVALAHPKGSTEQLALDCPAVAASVSVDGEKEKSAVASQITGVAAPGEVHFALCTMIGGPTAKPAEELLDWALYHLGLGVRHIYLYDNSQHPSDGEHHRSALKNLLAERRMTHIPYYGLWNRYTDNRQFIGNSACLRRFSHLHDMFGFWDLDEWFVPTLPAGDTALHEAFQQLLKYTMARYPPSAYSGVSVTYTTFCIYSANLTRSADKSAVATSIAQLPHVVCAGGFHGQKSLLYASPDVTLVNVGHTATVGFPMRALGSQQAQLYHIRSWIPHDPSRTRKIDNCKRAKKNNVTCTAFTSSNMSMRFAREVKLAERARRQTLRMLRRGGGNFN
uniref:Glycosyltransferase family 92 protein n=1 Tax=Chrysotila carterae TaxID=13221 RepID=A0A7S4B425_CHRCT